MRASPPASRTFSVVCHLQVSFPLFDVFEVVWNFHPENHYKIIVSRCLLIDYFSRQSFYPPPKSQNCTEYTNKKQGCEITSSVMQPRPRLKRLCCSAWPTSEGDIKPDSWCPHCAVAVSLSEHHPVTAPYNLSAEWYCFWSTSCRSWELWIKANFTKINFYFV